ncbi:MAG TPA: gamma-glutamyltransferase [Bryobacteraceae bacterium]|nr:gamma-glutamyltransferase [Bryobacteraceae bacterium]
MLIGTMPVHSQDRNYARSMVISRQGIVATSQTLASQAGAQILARGGSAMDAAIAANAVLGAVEPMSDGIGGDLFAIYWDAKTGKLTGINASGWSPKALTIEYLRSKGITTMPQNGIQSVTVPGCVDGWEKLHRKFGRLPWRDLFQPAIYYAANGFPVTELIAGGWSRAVSTLELDENGRLIFLRDGRAPETGEIFRNPELEKALALIADGGAAAFYRGAIAKAILKTSDRLGGTMAGADLSEFQSEWVEPIATEYRGWKVYELPPNGQGMGTLEMLNIMERFPLGSYAAMSAEAFHIKMEAQKLAYADLQRYLADPRFAKVPIDGIVSKKYAAERAALIDPKHAQCEPKPGDPKQYAGDTIYLAAVDREGNIASLIQSVYLSFGSGVVVEGFGFHLQDRGGLFEMDPEHPNALAGRKRPFHTIIPAFMEKGSTHIGYGIMGGLNQAQAHAQFVSNMVDHGMNIQAALEAPRFTKLTFGGCDVMIEARVPADVRSELSEMGHRLELQGDFSSWMGGGQVVVHDSATGVNYAASSPRKDGAAVPEAPDYFAARKAKAGTAKGKK